MKNKIKVGTKITNKEYGDGKVIFIDDGDFLPYLVQFDIPSFGCHNGDGRGKDNSCRWMNKSDLTISSRKSKIFNIFKRRD